jgi:hypothetical protein
VASEELKEIRQVKQLLIAVIGTATGGAIVYWVITALGL